MTTRALYYEQKRAERHQAFLDEVCQSRLLYTYLTLIRNLWFFLFFLFLDHGVNVPQMEALKLEEEAEMSTTSPEIATTRLQEDSATVLRVQDTSKPIHNGENSSSKSSKKKDLTKAERREIQERQRAEKAASKGLPVPARPPSPVLSKGSRKASATINVAVPPAGSDSSRPSLPLDLFVHLDGPTPLSVAQRTNPHIHVSILRLAHLYSHFKIVGATARCMGMLEAFKEVQMRSSLFFFTLWSDR